MKKLLIVLNLIAFIFSMGCTAHKEMELRKTKFLVTSPLRKDTTLTREYVSQIRSVNHVELRSLEEGYLEEIFVDEGKFVEKGQLMFRILPIKFKAELQKAEAEANYVEIEYKNAKILADSNVISPVQLALAKAKWEKAKAELELAKVRLSFTEIKAPFSGYMDKFYVRVGSLLATGDLLTTMSDLSNLWVYFNVPEAEYLDYKSNLKGDSLIKVQLKMANHKFYNHTGSVKAIQADFDNTTGTIAFRATFPNPEGLLKHGQTGNAIISIPIKRAILVPQKATFEVLDQKYVYILDKDNQLKARRIMIDAELPDLYVIREGVDEHDKILLEGLRLVRENDKIDYDYLDSQQVISKLKIHAE